MWRPLLTLVAGVIGACVGFFVFIFSHKTCYRAEACPYLVEYSPMPHHVPQHRGGASFRFAMAHDVIHERFPKHGPAHYRERNRLTREQLAALAPDDPAAFPLTDDLAVGLERLGRPDEAIPLMRDKLARQQARGLSGRDLYTSYANLGTFLIHAHFPKAVAGDPAAKERCREGLGFIRRSVEVNPEAHFGRERWQAAIAEFLLAAADDPELVKTFDCIGNGLGHPPMGDPKRADLWSDRGYGRAADSWMYGPLVDNEFPDFLRPAAPADDPAHWEDFHEIRKHILRIGSEYGWPQRLSHSTAVAFDEPMLGIIGMWRQGGGANPHFALAVGETMLRVGQRHIAWAAFERAHRLADRYWRDPAVQQFLRDHCLKRQGEIEESLLAPPPKDDWAARKHPRPLSKEEVAALRPRFEAELALGEGYQRAYQEYEEKKIAAGVPITDPRFFDEFHAGREPIASPTGPEEWLARMSMRKFNEFYDSRRRGQAYALLGGSLAALAMALLLRWWSGRSRIAEEGCENQPSPTTGPV
ncbi:MAG: hypothetical protein JWO38_6211 [Gemmataceae bacterium]|nr:hypothetical protein [Gemmataceae bacterium]